MQKWSVYAKLDDAHTENYLDRYFKIENCLFQYNSYNKQHFVQRNFPPLIAAPLRISTQYHAHV